jgi:hypothetical protein
LILVAASGGPTMIVRIGVMKALNRRVERVFNSDRKAPPVIPGWDGISSCSFMVSFDGKRRLWLSENHFARIEEPDQVSADGS